MTKRACLGFRKFILLSLLCAVAVAGRAQLPPIPSDPFRQLTTWSFEDTSWYSDLGYPPLSFTNLNNSGSFDGNALQVDSTNNAWLQYNIFESDGTTNLTLNQGTVELWVLPDWNSATNGGTGPGDWGRLIDVGAFSTNSPSSWWSLYFSPDGNNIYFSSETNGVFTNYLNCPISWDTNTWHFLALAYNRFHSALYIDGQLVTNGSGALYLPTAEVISNGFFVGSDDTGWAQSRALIDDVATYNYALSAYQVTNDYAGWLQILNGGGFHADDGPSLPGGFGGGTNGGGGGFSYTPPDYGSNLWIAAFGIVSNVVPLLLSNTEPDVLYEIQGRTNLAQGEWFSQGFVNGSEVTNCTAATVFASKQGNLFLRVRSWADDTGTGIPDWWWLQYFGQMTNVDAYAADPAGDGYTDFQKFQMGLNPLNYHNTNPPDGFFGCLDVTGTNVVLEWSNAPGPVAGYIVQRGIYNATNNGYYYTQFTVSSNAVFFKDVGAISSDNSWNDIYNLQAVYPDGSLTATDTWYASDAQFGLSGPPDGAPLPGDVYAYAHPTSTNVFLSWTPAAGLVTNYIILRGVYDTNIYDYDYSQIATVNSNVTYLSDVGVIHSTNDWSDVYQVEAIYPGGGLSQPVTTGISTNSTPPTDFTATVDSTGTNVVLTWTPPPGSAVTNYVIQRAIYNTNTSSYGNFSTIGQVSGGTISFVDPGAITDNNSLNNGYQIAGINTNGDRSVSADFYLPGPPSPPTAFNSNIYLTAYLIRNGTGRWQVMFSGFPTNAARTIKLAWTGNGTITQNISTTNLINGTYPISDTDVVNLSGDSLAVQLFGPDGEPGQVVQAGVLANDAPYFVDGRRHMKQNLNFLIRGAGIYLPYKLESRFGGLLAGNYNQGATNFEEFSFLHHGSSGAIVQNGRWAGGIDEDTEYSSLNNLWPFSANFELQNFFLDTTIYTNTSTSFGSYYPPLHQFVFQPDFNTNVPAPAGLDYADPYWIIQPQFGGGRGDFPESLLGLQLTPDVNSNSYKGGVTLQSGKVNLFGLAIQTGCLMKMNLTYYYPPGPTNRPAFDILNPGDTESLTDGEHSNNWAWTGYASQCPAPTLVFNSYYFAPLINPLLDSTYLPGSGSDNSTFGQDYIQHPTPIDDTFSVTNQTPPLIVGTVGQPMIVASWAKYSISNSSPAKYAYLGQYFATNALLLDNNGAATTNSAGILSPYGEFFPLRAGAAALVTMPDIDTGQQGTNVIKVISLNVDANHDGTMDFSYSGPDQTSPSRPFRFWANDNQDSGDYGGNFGIPGLLYPQADGWNFTDQAGTKSYDANGAPIYHAHGRRDLVDFFPVYLNIGSLFQSNAISPGINPLDTNYIFALSHVDSALRFAYTDLTPTNYMNYLRDTIESSNLAYTALTTITNGKVPLSPAFLAGIAANNQGIILVEAAFPANQPLVLTIYHGTNQIAQTSLPLSIGGVEDMFRHKNLLLNTPPVTPDRLADADVPNEPDTIDRNFVFLHGYNVKPYEARGVAADMFKRMYWSGSHAKFYAVTWEGADSKIGNVLTPNYHTNVVNAFNTAPLLANFIASLTNSGPVVVSAHSLGNMVTLSAISDWNAPISQYFMLDAAVPIEAIDPASTNVSFMTFSTWAGYTNRLFAADWYKFFPTNDDRSMLFWNNRLGNLGTVDVYNFYSSGEEVLRLTAGDPPLSTINILATQIINRFSLISLWSDVPFGTYTWYWQEKGKGTCNEDGLIGSSHGGWQFNNLGYSTNVSTMGILYQLMSPGAAAQLTDSQLRTNSFFDFNSDNNNYDIAHPDAALLGSGGSAYAQANRNRILSDAIPAMSLVAGANPVPKFSPPISPSQKNIDMMTLKNGWSLGRTGDETGMWHHSDFVQMAYPFTYQLFDEFVTTGNLK